MPDTTLRMQMYISLVHDGPLLLKVVRGWLQDDSRLAFALLYRVFYPDVALDNDAFQFLGAPFEAMLKVYAAYYRRLDAYVRTRRAETLHPLPLELAKQLRKLSMTTETFLAKMEAACVVATRLQQMPRSGHVGPLQAYHVPVEANAAVFFVGPHAVDSDDTNRIVAYLRAFSEEDARAYVQAQPTHPQTVDEMAPPPDAKGKRRSRYPDTFLQEAGVYEQRGCSFKGRIYDEASISELPEFDGVRNERIRAHIEQYSSYVERNVLLDDGIVASWTQRMLQCLCTVVDVGVRKQEQQRTELREWIDANGGLDALLQPPADPRSHERCLRTRLATMCESLREFAMSVFLRAPRNPGSASWKRFHGDGSFAHPADVDSGGRKILLDVAEAQAELCAAPTTAPTIDGPLCRADGDTTTPASLWHLVRNLGGHKAAVALRYALFTRGLIPDPHLGAWVSAKKSWTPPRSTPVGNWQNVYQLLTCGMLDMHHMPEHTKLGLECLPAIVRVYNATSDAPKTTRWGLGTERFNIRTGESTGIPWHTDQNPLARLGGKCAPAAHAADVSDDSDDDVPLAQLAKRARSV